MTTPQLQNKTEQSKKTAPARKAHGPATSVREAGISPLEVRVALDNQPLTRPDTILRLQRMTGNHAVQALLHNKALVGQAYTPAAPNVIQRALGQPQLDRLRDHLGTPKYKKVKTAGLEEYFDKWTDAQLERCRAMQNTKFDALLAGLQEGGALSTAAGGVDKVAQIADMLSAAVETGESAAEVAAALPSMLATAGSAVSSVVGGAFGSGALAVADTALEKTAGGVGGLKDTYEGGSSMLKQHKFVEGAMGVASGLSGLASLIPGVPDAVGVASAGAKTLGGVTKMINTKINRNAIERLKADANADPNLGGGSKTAFLAALDVFADKLGYTEGLKQAAFGAIEGGGSLLGGVGKWGATLFSKTAETAYNVSAYATRAVASTITSSVESNAQVQAREEQTKAEDKDKLRAAVEAAVDAPDYIGRLHRLAVLIEPEYAEELDRAVSVLPAKKQPAVEAAIQAKNTWNPS